MDRGALGIVMHIARFWGVAPFTRGTYEISKPILYYGYALIFALTTHETINRVISTIQDPKRMLALDYIGVMGDASMVLFFIIGGHSITGRIRRMAESIRLLEQIDKTTSLPKNAIWDKYTIATLIFGIAGTMFHVSNIITFWYTSEDWQTTILYVIKGQVLGYIQMQIMVFPARVLISLEEINKRLHELAKSSNSRYNEKVTNVWGVAASRRKNVLENEGWVDNNIDKSVLVVPDGPEHTLRRLATCYGHICDIVRSSTDAEGFLIVLILVYQMLHVQLQLFRIFMWMLIPFRDNLNYAMFISIVFIFLHIISLIVFNEPFHQTHVQMKITHYIVQSLKLSSAGRQSLHNEVDLFLHSLALADTRYSPLHVCTLNRSLSFKIMGCLITYLVIMLTYGPEFKTPAMIRHSKWN